MANTSILDLPTELLQKTFDYLDWDRSEHLTPWRPDIFSLSLTCRHLRRAVLPFLFRNVTLKLRWVDGALVEPALLRIRTQCPDLAQYVKCVHIETHFVQLLGSAWRSRLFTVPEGITDWTDPAAISYDDDGVNRRQSHRLQVSHAARSIFESPQYAEVLSQCPKELQSHAQSLARQLLGQSGTSHQPSLDSRSANSSKSHGKITEDTLHGAAREELTIFRAAPPNFDNNNQCSTLRRQLDALFIVMLCLPPDINSLVLQALPTDGIDVLPNTFALHVAAMAFKVFSDQLQRLTMITCPISHEFRPHIRDSFGAGTQATILSPGVLNELRVVKKLTLGSRSIRGGDQEHARDLTRWHTISNTVTDLELCKVQGEAEDFVKLVQGFTSLLSLRLNDIKLVVPRHVRRQNPETALSTAWLAFLIELRRQAPTVIFRLHNLQLDSTSSLSSSGMRWLLEEAVPTGCQVDFERETRLMEDFESFFLLWGAEDSERGDAAREARKDGKLVDAAMSSRWRGLMF